MPNIVDLHFYWNKSEKYSCLRASLAVILSAGS